jgi:hypothetical protein
MPTVDKHKTGAFLLGRRAFLAGAGGALLTLPFLESIHGHARAAAGVPRRFIVWHQGQGTQYDQLAIAGSSETNFTLGPILQPLAAFRDRMVVIHGIDSRAGNASSGDGHVSAKAGALCAVPNQGGASIDQLLWDRIHTAGHRSPLHLAVGTTQRLGRFLSGPTSPVESEGDPSVVWSSLFADLAVPETDADRRRRRRLRTLDAVRESFASLRARIPSEDRDRLDRHAAQLDEVETRIGATHAGCTAPTGPGTYDHNADWTRAANDMFDVTIASFSCDMTPVVTIEWTDDHDPTIFAPYLGGFANWHEMVHSGESMRGIPGLPEGYTFYAQRMAELLGKLARAPEPMGDGTMLDHTTILWTCDFGYGAGHNKNSMQSVLLGSLGSGVPMGRLMRFTDPEDLWTASPMSNNNLFTSVMHAFGQNDVAHVGYTGDGVMMGPVPGLIP